MRRTLRAVILLVALPAAALAQSEQGDERPHMPPAPPRAFVPTSPAFRSVMPGFTLVQANVNGQGQNIVGDAANEPSIAIDPTAPNRIVIGWRQFDSIQSNFRQAGYAWSNDGGRSWHAGVINPGVFRTDPVVESDSLGNFYYYSLRTNNKYWCDLSKSYDGGQVWVEPVEANGGDRAWMTIDKSGGVGDGNIYGLWSWDYSCCDQQNFGRDTDGGTFPWPPPVQTPTLPNWGTVCVGPDGEVYVIGYTGSVVKSLNAQFSDQKPSFSTMGAIKFGGLWPYKFPGSPAGISGQAWIDANRAAGSRRGHVYALGLSNPPGDDPADVAFVSNVTPTGTWSEPVRVNDDPQGINNWTWFPSMSVSPDGERIDVTYNSTHESNGNTKVSRTYYTYSTDEGQTWTPAEAFTPSWNSSLGYPNQSKIGDYYDQESDDVGAFVAIAATMNGEQDVYFVRVGDWDCNRNGIGDQIDLADGTLTDCDENGIPDECEIAAGAKEDLNGNGIPDICDLCYADCDGSGSLDIDDFICFQTLYGVNDLAADCDGSGDLDVDDFICFQTAFGVGCP